MTSQYIMKLTQLTILALFICIAGSGCATRMAIVKDSCPKPYTIKGRTYHPLKKAYPGFFQRGIASWYGPGFNGRKTASGEIYDMHTLTAAHNILPLNTLVRVTNLSNNKDVVVRINDRGPFVGERVIDLSLAAAQEIGMVAPGTTPVRVSVIGPANSMLAAGSSRTQKASTRRSAPNPFFSSGRNRLLALRDP
jgi:peptidoglycan lytic transglycosylase